MEYVEGANVADLFDSYWGIDPSGASVIGELRMLLDGVAAWLARFHSAFGYRLARGDAILRNFIIKGDLVWGIDFEESSERDPLIDVGQTCSNILSLEPQFTPAKFLLTKEFASLYWRYSGRNRSHELPDKIAEGLRHYAQFRDDSVRLEEWAGNIERRGLDQ